eukprot:TRINITY_DN22370_c0_g1_i1.p3 TRINITY_DN22370_c0_g1~~TRINITY_DN22370_c0_g1_i1.p3  ORF type:complete len:141 (-),score=5.55 TRINITY_DN22370_c0_g1_i1:232-654(-)
MAHNVRRAVSLIERKLQSEGHLGQTEHLFDVGILKHRGHTQALSRKRKYEIDKPHGTCKPLGRNFGDLKRVILIDDDEYKAEQNEKENMILLPSWNCRNGFAQNDKVLETLVNQLISQLSNTSDVRNHTAQISRLLFAEV